jgi:hypothetical protein
VFQRVNEKLKNTYVGMRHVMGEQAYLIRIDFGPYALEKIQITRLKLRKRAEFQSEL